MIFLLLSILVLFLIVLFVLKKKFQITKKVFLICLIVFLLIELFLFGIVFLLYRYNYIPHKKYSNEQTRGHTLEILNSIGLLQENGFKTGAVMVVNKTNIANLINEYKLFDSMGVGLKLNPIFIDGEAKQHVNDLGINPDEYVKHFVEFFRYWSTDKTGNINVTTCHELVNLILNEHSGVCTFNSCLGKWLCLDLDANIYPCDRLCTLDYSYGNVDNLSDISQIFESDVFYHLLKKVLKEDLIV